MKKILLLPLLLLALLATNSYAATHPMSLPIGSKAELQSYALLQIKKISGMVHEHGNLTDNRFKTGFTVAYNSQTPTSIKLAQLVASRPVSFVAEQPEKNWISFHLEYSNEDGLPLFTGNSVFKLEQNKGISAWVVPERSRRVNMALYWKLPIVLPFKIDKAHIEGENGTETVSVISGTEVDTLLFPIDDAGKNNSLVIRYRDDSTTVREIRYSTQSGFITKESFIENTAIKPTIDGVVYVSGPFVTIVDIKSTNGTGYSPLLETTVENDTWYYFHGKTEEQEIATGIFILNLEYREQGWSYYPKETSSTTQQPVFLKAGTYHIMFDWEHFRQPEE